MNTAMKTGLHCPGCRWPLGLEDAHCNGCGIWLAGPQGSELRRIDAELERVDAARTWLISRRAALLEELSAIRRQSASDVREPAGQESPAGGRSRPRPAPADRRPVKPRPEMSVRTAARLLLAAGAALVVIAVIVFTVANWARIGPLGRLGILLAATAIVLAAPFALIRRRLRATAESVAAIGLGLTIADAFLLARLSSFSGELIGAAAGTAALAGLWAAYGAAARLTGPKVAAIALSQLPVPLAAVGLARLVGPVSPPAGSIAVALIVDAAAGIVVTERAGRRGHNAEAVVACVAAAATWACGVLLAVALVAMQGSSAAIWLAITLVGAAAVAVAGPRGRLAAVARPAARASGALLAVGLAAPLTEVVAGGWSLAAVCGSAGLVSAVAMSLGRKYPRAALAASGAAVVLAGVALLALPAAVASLFPVRWPLPPAWSGSVAQYAAASVWPGIRPAAAVLALTAFACWVPWAPAAIRGWMRSAGTLAGALAVASLPAAAQMAGWAAFAAPTAAVVMLLAVGAPQRPRGTATSAAPAGDEVLARLCMAAAFVLAVSATLRSLAAPAETIAELAALSVAFGTAAALARRSFAAAVATGGALAAATGLACALPLAYGWPARYAALVALGVAVAAVGVATRLRHSRPVHSTVLDLGAAAIALLCAALTAGWRDEFALLAVAAALTASITAWLRTGVRRQLTLLAAGCAAVGALIAQWQPLARALLAPGRLIAHPWHGHPAADGGSPGLTLAVIVLAVCLAALVTAVGAWRGSGRASMDAVALALPVVVAPAGVAGAAALPGTLGYWVTVVTLLALTVALTGWAALGQSAMPGAAALVTAALAVSWALAAPGPTLVVLGTLTVLFPLAAWRAADAGIKAGAASLSVVAAAGLAECAVLAAGGAGWHAAMAVLAVAALAQLAAARIGRELVSLTVEATGWLAAAVGLGQCMHRPESAALALAVAGLTCLGVAARAARRAAVWPALGLLYAAWCCWLVAGGVSVAELYTSPGAVIVIAFGMSRIRRDPELGSWLTLGPGLALALVPSLIGVWAGSGWIRPAVLGVAAAGVALAGARTAKQAPLAIGVIVVVLDAGRALSPTFLALIHAVPGWIPIAALGAALLWAGATYEARLRNVRAIRRSLTAMN
jgi:hypothetical protein